MGVNLHPLEFSSADVQYLTYHITKPNGKNLRLLSV